MASTLNTPTKLNTRVWQYKWSGTAPFRVFDYERGQYALQDSDDTSIILLGDSDIEPPAIEVFDSTETANPEGVTHPGKLVIQWRGNRYAELYRVEKYADAVWTEVHTQPENGSGTYKFTTSLLDDITSTQYRVVNVDLSGAESTLTTITSTIVRNPDPPLLTYSYSSGTGDLTVAAVS